jgi:hypothetical protein
VYVPSFGLASRCVPASFIISTKLRPAGLTKIATA